MFRTLFRKIKKRKYQDIDPEDIFIDSTNLPGFEEHRFKGRMEKPIGRKTFSVVKIVLALMIFALISKLWTLDIKNGSLYARISENNRLEHTLIFADRGVIYDRNMLELATNVVKDGTNSFASRLYSPIKGLSHAIGYLKYPLSDRAGFYYEEHYRGRDGAERVYDDLLQGKNGLKLRETNVFGEVISESVIKKPTNGSSIVLSIDARLTEVLYKAISSLAVNNGFIGGAAVLMDVRTGEVIALTTLNEGLISPTKQILSTGSITVKNPYDSSKPSVFKDWKAHGWTDMRKALAVSSDTYFYSIGGGFEDQKGLGITALDKYFQLFALTEKTGIELLGEVAGIIPTPEWKKEKFNGEIWRLGDTYITAIGQYGTQITPLNAVRFVAAIANGGNILTPSVLLGGNPEPVKRAIKFDDENWRGVREGMRESVTYGTAVGLNVPYVRAAAKTGTAEIGSAKLLVNSWSVGFFPFENPKYAWAVVMERGPSANTLGASSVIRQLFDWMAIHAPEYFK